MVEFLKYNNIHYRDIEIDWPGKGSICNDLYTCKQIIYKEEDDSKLE